MNRLTAIKVISASESELKVSESYEDEIFLINIRKKNLHYS